MKLFYRIGFIIYVLALIGFYFCPSTGITTSVEVNSNTYRVDYLLHGFAFLVLPIVAFLANGDRKRPYLWWIFIGFSFILAIAFEFIQQLVPERAFNPKDTLSNIIGLSIGVALVLMYRKCRKSNGTQ
ncbi:MAG TPA: VanZ family protein [Bacteroidales bacterium]|nr:VanZ family protein [Bacteroidales bacterium]